MVSSAMEKASSTGGRQWAIVSRRAITPEGERAAALLIRDEKIVDVVAADGVPADFPIIDVGDRVLLPGLVDTHVHINEPGRTEWEGFETATKAAAAGGVTTLVDMPLNSSPVTTSAAAFQQKMYAADGKLWVDCGFYGGIVPGNEVEIEPLIGMGVLGFKAFLCHSGIDDFPAATAAELDFALQRCVDPPLLILVHAELAAPLAAEVEARLAASPQSYAAYLATRPPVWEHAAIQLLIDLCRKNGGPIHIVHLASADALPMIAAARAEGLPLTVETCPHYLTFAAEEIPDGDTRFKCAPPLRERENRDRLWQGLREGLIDTIGSDHSPAPPALKHLDTGDLKQAWGGIASLQLTLPAVWTAAAPRGFTLSDVAKWMSSRPAKLVGLHLRKGALAPGYDADIVVFDPHAEWTVDAKQLHHRHKATPYEGRTLRGRVEATYLRGRKVYDSAGVVDAPIGRSLLRFTMFAKLDVAPLNALSEPDARAAFLRCCGSTLWAERMTSRRPFAGGADLFAAADKIWRDLSRADQLEAFAAHPKIGDVDSVRAKFASTASWSAHEQAGVAATTEVTLQSLAAGNRAYKERFGHIFIVCATGKTAEEMLALLQQRLCNGPADELRIAAAEQEKITRLRLERLCS
jgi:allantoinase